MRLVVGLLALLAGLAAAAGHALPGRGGHALQGSRAFSIDGRRFDTEHPSAGTRSVVERELAGRGIDTGSIPEHLRSLVDSGAVEAFREARDETTIPRLPGGLEPEHVLRLQSGTGPIEIAFGRLGRSPKDVLRHLRSAGWDCREVDSHGSPGAIAQLAGRKEASVVLLDEAQGRFLSIRRPVR